MGNDSQDSTTAIKETREYNNNVKNDTDLLGNPPTTMYSKATQDELKNIDLPLDDDTNNSNDTTTENKDNEESSKTVSGEGVGKTVQNDNENVSKPVKIQLKKNDTTENSIKSTINSKSSNADVNKELLVTPDNEESIGIDQDDDKRTDNIAEEEDGNINEKKKDDEDNDSKAMGIWDDNDAGAADPLSNNDPSTTEVPKQVQTIIINKVLTLRCIMCNSAIKFSCSSSTMSAGEKRAFKGKYRNHLLAEHNADDRYLGMEILVTKTFEIQFPNDNEKNVDNIEERADERSNTSPNLNLLTPQVELKEGDPDDEDIIMDKQIPPKNNWRNYWRGNRFGGPISMPPGLQVTMARNQGMMNQGFSQLGNNLRQQFGQIGQFRNPFQRQKSSEPITLDDEEDDDDSSSSSSSSTGSDSEGDSPTKQAPDGENKEKDPDAEMKDSVAYFDKLASKKNSDDSGLDIDNLPSRKKKNKIETDSSDGGDLLLTKKKKEDAPKSILKNSASKQKKKDDSSDEDKPLKKKKNDETSELGLDEDGNMIIESSKGAKNVNVSFSSSDKETEKQDDAFQEAFKIAQEDLNVSQEDLNADLPLDDSENISKKDRSKETEKDTKKDNEKDSKKEAEKDSKKEAGKESEKKSEKLPILPGVEIAPIPTNLPLPKDLEQQEKRMIPTINRMTGLPLGWRKETRRRSFGVPGFDIIIHNPKGRIFRSINELTKYCNKHPKRTMGINPRFVFSNTGMNTMSMPSQAMFHDPRGTVPIPKKLPLPPELGGTGEFYEDDDDVECIDL